MQQAKTRQDFFFFFPNPVEKPDQRYGAVGMQLWPYNTNSFCYQPFLVCLLCVILSDRRVWQRGRHNSFDSYKPGATKHRCAKTLPFHYFSLTIYIWCEAPIHTVASQLALPWVASKYWETWKVPGSLENKVEMRNPGLTVSHLLTGLCGEAPTTSVWTWAILLIPGARPHQSHSLTATVHTFLVLLGFFTTPGTLWA